MESFIDIHFCFVGGNPCVEEIDSCVEKLGELIFWEKTFNRNVTKNVDLLVGKL